jgi:hypothetical protein
MVADNCRRRSRPAIRTGRLVGSERRPMGEYRGGRQRRERWYVTVEQAAAAGKEERMATVLPPPDQRVVLRNVSWET